MAKKLDKLIEKVAPQLALKRAIARHNISVIQNLSTYATTSAGYDGGKTGRSKASISGSTANEDVVSAYTYDEMISSAMQLYRNDPITRSIVDVSTTYLGESRATATTDDQRWNEIATEYFNQYWWPQADARRRNGVDFGEIQTLFDRWCWLGGDMLFMLMDGQLLPYEGTQIRTPYKLMSDKQVINGIRVSADKPWPITHYYLTDGYGMKQSFERIRVSEAIFAGANNWRVSMLRSVPDLHGIIDALTAFGKTQDHVQKRIEFESMLFTIERKGTVGNMPASKLLSVDSTSGVKVEHSKADWGMRLKVNGDPERDFKLAQMQNPNGNYPSTMEWMARAITAGTGFPYEVVMHIYTNGSYTANRAARLDFSKAIMRRWAWRNKVLNQRVWNWRIAKAIKDGEIPPAPVSPISGVSQWHKVAWTLPHFPHIDEGKEVIADISQWGCGQESMADWAQQKGLTRDQLLDAHDADIRAMQSRADALGISLDMYMGKLFTAAAAKTGEIKNDEDDD